MEHVEAFKQKVQELGIIVYFKSLIASDPGVCVQCHSPCDSEFCSPHCEMKYWDEFNHQYTYHSGIMTWDSIWCSTSLFIYLIYLQGRLHCANFPDVSRLAMLRITVVFMTIAANLMLESTKR